MGCGASTQPPLEDPGPSHSNNRNRPGTSVGTRHQRPGPEDRDAGDTELQALRDRRAGLKSVTDEEIDRARQAAEKLHRDLEKGPADEAEERTKILNWKQAEVAEMVSLQAQALGTLDESIDALLKDAPPEAKPHKKPPSPTYTPQPSQEVPQEAPLSPRAPKAQPKKQPVNKVTANKVTAQVEQLRHQVEMPEEVLIGLTNVLSGGRATECFNGVPTDLMSTDDSEGSFVNYIEAASAFGEGRTTEDRVAYMFSVFDVDGDGYLGEQDLRTVLGSDASEAEVQSLTAEIGGDPVHGVTVEALIQYVKLHPGVEDALVMKTRADGGVASQLAARPLVLLVLKQGSGSVAEFVKSLDRFGPQVPIKEKLARVFDTLDEDGNGQLTLSEVALVSKECTGEEVEALFDKCLHSHLL
eukprot:TRINITY_DN7298_c0_g1_i5.p1 TRINITY_DN7298_c0_g1~~TRINITY_DN7298_c0_g1_i5.p1  ORF type:complete len:413 (+),score=105.80 TRINITY_DN7298_c0_g1_i5:242-1480(+)